MPETVTVPAIKAFEHDGRRFKVGDAVTVSPVVAASLAFSGVVSLLSGYRTCVMRAPETVLAVPVLTPPAAAPPRRVRRRKAKAE